MHYFFFGGVGSAGLFGSCLPGKSAGFMLTSPVATSSYSGLRQSLQIFIEPADNMLQPLHAMPWLS